MCCLKAGLAHKILLALISLWRTQTLSSSRGCCCCQARCQPECQVVPAITPIMTDLVRLEQSMLPARLSAAFAIPMQGQDLIPTATAQAELSQRGALHPAGSLHPSAPGAWPAARPSLPDHPLQPGHAAWQGAFGFPQAFGAASDAAAAAAAAAAAQADRAVPQAPGAGYPSGHPEAVAATTGGAYYGDPMISSARDACIPALMPAQGKPLPRN